jgi:hypothetical protein
MAKLAVLTCHPPIYTTHCPRSLVAPGLGLRPGSGCDELDPQGVFPSERRTPFSRANCSRVIGMKDPVITVSQLGDSLLEN